MHANHHCFRKFGYADKESSTELRSYHKYTLAGIARPDICGLDIYLYFFNSPFTKQHFKQEPKNVSTFFQAFSRLFIMKSLFYRNYSLTLAKEIENIIDEGLLKFLKKETKSQDKIQEMIRERKILIKQAKNIGRDIEKFYHKVLEKGKQSQQEIRTSFVEYATALDHLITEFLEDYMTKLKDKITKVMHNEYVPQGLEEDDIFLYVKTNLQSINCIEIMRPIQRLALMKQLNYLNPIIGLKMPKKVQSDTFEIIVRNFTNEREPILISLADQAMHRKGMFKVNQESQTWGVLVQNIILAFCQFRTESGRCLPKITARDVYFDQHSLKVGLLYDNVLLEALGMLNPGTKSMEARLVFGLTPITNEEDCYLEDVPNNQWKLREKYYLKGEEENDDVLLEMQEKIHVWRIMDLIFYLNTQQHLTQHYFRKEYPNILFDIGEFKKTRKKVYDSISEFKQQIWDIFPNPARAEYQNESKSFNFSLWELRNMVGKYEQDSFLKGLHPIRIWRQLAWRKELFWQIHEMLTHQDQFFARLKNPKKYIVILLLDYMEYTNYLRILRLHPEGVREEYYLNEEYQKRIKRITEVYDKLKSYYDKPEDHAHRKYLEDPARKEIFARIVALHKKWIDVAENDVRLREKQQKLKEQEEAINYGDREETIQKIQQFIQVIEKKIEQKGGVLMLEAKRMAAAFMQKEMNGDLLYKPENVNKRPPPKDPNDPAADDEAPLWIGFSRYICKKLSVSVTALLCLNSSNWKRYENLCRSVLACGRKVMDTYKEIKLKKEFGEMQLRSAKLEVVQKWLAEEVNKDAELEILRQSYRPRAQM